MGTIRKKEQRCFSRSRVTACLLMSFLALSAPTSASPQAPIISQHLPDANRPPIPTFDPAPFEGSHEFTLRHIFHHGTYQDPRLHKRHDVKPDAPLWVASDDGTPGFAPYPTFYAKSRGENIQRLADRRVSVIEDHLSVARRTGQAVSLAASDWTFDEVSMPNVTDKETVVNLAMIAANAYDLQPGVGEWEDVGQGFNFSQSFGWEGDGLRGHIFADNGNQTIVISLKGTSPAVFDGDGTTTRDKINDNLFFSCCCAQGGQYFWRQVCDCYSSTFTCNNTCLVQALKNENRYYRAAIELYTNVTELYPDSNVWLIGHSLGGSVSSLLGITFGVPTVTFEAPGEALASARLGLPAPPAADPKMPQKRSYTGSYHFGHTADPVFMGTCNGATATCTLGGYAMESQCHTGLQCVYDTVTDLGWRVGIGNHKIHNVIDGVLKKYDEPAKCVPDNECVDCFNWKYFESNGSTTTTSSSSSTSTTSSMTRTTTCETPGWWGCLDKTTTTTSTTSSSSTSSSTTTTTTSTCKTPGWFGCKDPTTTTSSTTATAIPAPSATITSMPTITTPSSIKASRTSSMTSCEHYGFWGNCLDETSTAKTSRPTTAAPSGTTASPTSSITSCKDYDVFGFCLDETSTSGRRMPTTATPSGTTVTPTTSCQHYGFWGNCLDETSSSDRGMPTTGTSQCETPGLFWGCRDLTSTYASGTPSITAPPTQMPTTTSSAKPSKECTKKGWFGLICLDRKTSTNTRKKSHGTKTEMNESEWKDEI